MRKLFTTTYHPQINDWVEGCSRTLLSALRKYIGDDLGEWDPFSDDATYAYNTEVYKTFNIAPFELVLFNAPKSITGQGETSLEDFET